MNGINGKIDPATEQAARKALAVISRHYDVVHAIIFGSRARGNHHPNSDLDIALLLPGVRKKFIGVTLDMTEMTYDILLETGIRIDPLPIWMDEWEQPENHSNPALLDNINREGMWL